MQSKLHRFSLTVAIAFVIAQPGLGFAQSSLDDLSDEDLVQVDGLLETIEHAEADGDVVASLEAYQSLHAMVPGDPYFALGYGIALVNAVRLEDAQFVLELLIESTNREVREAASHWLIETRTRLAAQDDAQILAQHRENAEQIAERIAHDLVQFAMRRVESGLAPPTLSSSDALQDPNATASGSRAGMTPYIAAGSAVMLLTGGVFSFLAIDARSAALDHEQTRPQSEAHYDIATTNARNANLSFAAAGLLGAGAWWSWRLHHRNESSSLAIRPTDVSTTGIAIEIVWIQ